MKRYEEREMLLGQVFGPEISDAEVEACIKSVPPHFSANLIVDLRNTAMEGLSISVGSGSNLTIGNIVDLQHADTFCNVWVAAGVGGGSGAIQVSVQDSDVTTSGGFTDPTSGLPQFPCGSDIQSGGNCFANSGLWASGAQWMSVPISGAPLFQSGGIQFFAFQRKQQYARLVLNSGPFPGAILAGFVTQMRTTGSGGGFTFNPGSGTVNV